MNKKVLWESDQPSAEIEGCLAAHSIMNPSEPTALSPASDSIAENQRLPPAEGALSLTEQNPESSLEVLAKTQKNCEPSKLQSPMKIKWRSLMLEP